MKILVLENDPREFALIQQVLSNGSTIIQLTSSEQAWQYIQSGESRFLIANWDTSDLRETEFIPRARAAKLVPPLYILLTTSKDTDDDLAPSDADDMVQKPFKAQDIKNRIGMGERIVSLAGNLAVARDQLEHHAAFDGLTGFMNRAVFFRQSMGEMERARRSSMPLSLISLDVDDFNAITNSFGDEIGDEVLRAVAQAIRDKSRPYDNICRWGEHEFVIMLSGVIGADAEKITERILSGVRGTSIEIKDAPSLNIKVSVGIASAAHVGTSTEIEPLIQQARQAMSHAKEAGGDQISLVFV